MSWLLFSFFFGLPEIAFFAPLGPQDLPKCNFKQLVAAFGKGGADVRFPNCKNAFREKTNKNDEKNGRFEMSFDGRFRKLQKSRFWPPGGPQKPVSKI